MEHIGTIFVVAVLTFFVVIIALLTFAQFRSAAPNAYHCRRCNADFTKPAHHDFPDRCAECGARDWNKLAHDGEGQELREDAAEEGGKADQAVSS